MAHPDHRDRECRTAPAAVLRLASVTCIYEFLAILWMTAACFISLRDDPQNATFAAGLSIAMGTLALVHEHRRR